MSALTISKLYNLDESRTGYIQPLEEFKVPLDSEGKVYLNHIPKKNTLTVFDKTLQIEVQLVNFKKPGRGEAWFEYRDEYDYVAAKGMLIFNEDDVKEQHDYEAKYVPVASRVDAKVINQLIDATGGFGTVWTKEELLEPAQEDIIAWTAIKNRPGLATVLSDGLMSKEDKLRIELLPTNITVPPVTKLVFTDIAGENPVTFFPNAWGDPLSFKLSDAFNVNKATAEASDSGVITLSENGVRQLIGLTASVSDALTGTTPTEPPSSTNKFVTDKDPRMADAREPLTHQHAIMDVVGLQSAINGKAEISHEHSVDDISGVEALRGEDGLTPNITVDPVTIPGAPGTSPEVTNISDNPQNVILRFKIPVGKDGAVKWSELTEEEKAAMAIPGPKGETGNPAAVLIGDVYTGEAGTQVEISAVGPVEKEISGQVYEATTLNMTIPKGDKGEQGIRGIPAAAKLGTVTTTDNDQPAVVVVHDPEIEEIGGKEFYVSKVDFSLPRGPRGTASVRRIQFTEDAWGTIDEDENYTIQLVGSGAIPVSPAYEIIAETAERFSPLATVKYNATYIYITADHKFSGEIFVEG